MREDGRIVQRDHSAAETTTAVPGFVYWLMSPCTSVQNISGAHSTAQTKAVGPGWWSRWSSSDTIDDANVRYGDTLFRRG